MSQEMEISEFVRLFPLRKGQIMWLLGAGCSVSAGIPTAWDIVWDFKRLLYCSQNRKSLNSVPQVADPSFRRRLGEYMASKPGFPGNGSTEEYAFYFEETYPDERERRRYIAEIVRSARPSLGHKILAGLIRDEFTRHVWTTNFDRLVEDSVADLLGSLNELTVASIDNSHLAREAIVDDSRKLLVKLHGDFHSRRLKNTVSELRDQDAVLRSVFSQSCGRFGLVVIGYSGRDESVMSALHEAVDIFGNNAFPGGLFWVHRSNSPPSKEAVRLVDHVVKEGGTASFIRSESFDEFMIDVSTLIPGVEQPSGVHNPSRAGRLSGPEIPDAGTQWPVVRMNALPVLSFPSICRLVDCDIGGSKAVREAIAASEASVIGVRKRFGVVCFGSDEEVRRTFAPFKIKNFSLHSIETNRLASDSALLGLISEALVTAISRSTGLAVSRKNNAWLLSIPPGNERDARYGPLRDSASQTGGIVPKTKLHWNPAIGVHVQFCLGKMWILFDPSEFIERIPVDVTEEERIELRMWMKEFQRERSAKVYNRQLSSLFDGWLQVLSAGQTSTELRYSSFETGAGIDAVFTVSRITGFSRRIEQ